MVGARSRYHSTQNVDETAGITLSSTVVGKFNYDQVADMFHGICYRDLFGSYQFSSQLCDALQACYMDWETWWGDQDASKGPHAYQQGGEGEGVEPSPHGWAPRRQAPRGDDQGDDGVLVDEMGDEADLTGLTPEQVEANEANEANEASTGWQSLADSIKSSVARTVFGAAPAPTPADADEFAEEWDDPALLPDLAPDKKKPRGYDPDAWTWGRNTGFGFADAARKAAAKRYPPWREHAHANGYVVARERARTDALNRRGLIL